MHVADKGLTILEELKGVLVTRVPVDCYKQQATQK